MAEESTTPDLAELTRRFTDSLNTVTLTRR